jgi:hypothetical protein
MPTGFKGGIEADDDERLPQICAPPPLCVERGVRDPKDFGRHGGVAAHGLRDLGHLDVRIACEGNDVRGDPRRAREVDLRLQAIFEVAIFQEGPATKDVCDA